MIPLIGVPAGHQAETPPTITSNGGGPTATINVTAPATAVTTVTASGTSPITFSITGGADQALFSINPSSGVLVFKAASTAGNRHVTVTATNAFRPASNQAITVHVT